MRDLISRSELIKELNKYCGNQKYLVSENIREIINNQPTAYDVDKVVEEIEASGKNTDVCIRKIRAIEIVKQGGVRKDVSE